MSEPLTDQIDRLEATIDEVLDERDALAARCAAIDALRDEPPGGYPASGHVVRALAQLLSASYLDAAELTDSQRDTWREDVQRARVQYDALAARVAKLELVLRVRPLGEHAVDEIEKAADTLAMDRESAIAHYSCAMANWTATLDDRDAAITRAEAAEAGAAAAAAEVRTLLCIDGEPRIIKGALDAQEAAEKALYAERAAREQAEAEVERLRDDEREVRLDRDALRERYADNQAAFATAEKEIARLTRDLANETHRANAEVAAKESAIRTRATVERELAEARRERDEARADFAAWKRGAETLIEDAAVRIAGLERDLAEARRVSDPRGEGLGGNVSTVIGGRCQHCGRVVVHGHEARCLALRSLSRADGDVVEGFAAKIARDAQARRDELAALRAEIATLKELLRTAPLGGTDAEVLAWIERRRKALGGGT